MDAIEFVRKWAAAGALKESAASQSYAVDQRPSRPCGRSEVPVDLPDAEIVSRLVPLNLAREAV